MFELPTRIPRLYYGPSRPARPRTLLEKRADTLYGYLSIGSEFLFLIFGLIGLYFYQIYGLIAMAAMGYVLGFWIRRSLGIRGRKANTGFFKRMRERSQGSPPGLLERLLENISQTSFTPEKCKAVTSQYEKSVTRLRQAKTPEAQKKVLEELDFKVNQILYN